MVTGVCSGPALRKHMMPSTADQPWAVARAGASVDLHLLPQPWPSQGTSQQPFSSTCRAFHRDSNPAQASVWHTLHQCDPNTHHSWRGFYYQAN